MSVWSRISEAIAALAAGEGLFAIFDRLRVEPERSISFTIAIIALGAKLAKADGVVTRDEVAVFRKIFVIPPEDEPSAARIFNLARGDVAGFDAYARKIASLFNHEGQALCADDHSLLIDILEGLFQISLADGAYHPREDAFLAQVAQIFGLDERCFAMVRALFVAGAPRDPYDVLGIDPRADLDSVRSAWRAAVKECHPDVMIARGVPAEAVQMAANRLIIINNAWSEVKSLRAQE